MDFLRELFIQEEITPLVGMVRVVLAFVAGTLVGMERESNNEHAGMRTHILICVGATLLTLVSIFIPQSVTGFAAGDPARIAAQVVSGIGFLGAGAIVRLGVDVRGLTTSASIWVVAAIGIAVGAGLYLVAFGVVVLVLFTLYVLNIVEDRIFPKRKLKRLEIVVASGAVKVGRLERLMKELELPIRSTEVHHSFDDEESIYAFLVHFPRYYDYGRLYDAVGGIEGVTGFSLEDSLSS